MFEYPSQKSAADVRLSEVLQHLPAVVERVGDDVEILGVRADSRRVEPGDLFIAIPGLNVDGHRFIGDAVERGAAAVVGEVPPGRLNGRSDGLGYTYVQVLNAREAWGWSCAAWEGLPSREMTMIGVTGTDGKTTTVSLVHAILGAARLKAGLVSTVSALIPGTDDGGEAYQEVETGLHTTTPDPPEIQGHLAEMVERGATHAVLEVTSHGLAQHRVAGCDFDVAVLTNITFEHVDFHGTFTAYRETKAKLFEGLSRSFRKPGVPKACILNGDDESLVDLKSRCGDKQIVYSLGGTGDVLGRQVEFEPDRTRFRLHTAEGDADIETRLVGRHNVYNILAAASASVAIGISPEAIAEGVASVSGVPGRLERIEEGQPYLALVDFAHTPNALKQVLTTTRQMIDKEHRVIVVFGCTGLRDREKRMPMGRIVGQLADTVIVTAEDPRTEDLEVNMAECAAGVILEGKRKGVDLLMIEDRGRAIQRACEMAGPGDAVISCGKGHEQSMPFGTTEYPWDDREAMRLAIQGKALDTLPTADVNE